jgi:hypothetical protein
MTAMLLLRPAPPSVWAFLRQPWFIAVPLVQPMIWLLLFGQLFKGVTTMPSPDIAHRLPD